MRPLIPPPALALVLAILMWLAAHFVAVWRFAIPFQWIVALTAFAAGLAFAVLSFRAFRRAGTTVSPRHIEQASALVTTGTFAISRNPMYLGLLLMLAAWAILLGQALNLLLLMVFVVLIATFQIAPEERMLREKFGEAYVDYCRRVRRWI